MVNFETISDYFSLFQPRYTVAALLSLSVHWNPKTGCDAKKYEEKVKERE